MSLEWITEGRIMLCKGRAILANEKSGFLLHIYGMIQSFLVYKPYGVVSQFSEPVPGKETLGKLHAFPKDVYPVGRLDEDSEGLLILTNDRRQNQLLLGQKIEKEYWVQVEGVPTDQDLQPLRAGIDIRVKKKTHHTLPAEASLMPDLELPPRVPPIRVRKSIPDAWIRLVIREGKNRQVRKMTAAIGFPTLRLVRWRIGKYTLEGMKVGEVKNLRL